MTTEATTLLLARAGGQTFALPADEVERVLAMPALTPLPDAPRGVAGLLNLHGDVIPVVDVRWRLANVSTPPEPSQHLVVVAATGRARYALWVDAAERVVPAEIADWAEVGPTHGAGRGVSDTHGERGNGAQHTSGDAVHSADPAPLMRRIVRVDGAVIPVLSAGALDPGITVRPGGVEAS